ncbi:MAG: Ig-like domain-containing protein [Chlorobium sp.]
MAITRIFIDSRVNDQDLLISQFAPDTEYSVLDASRDGIEQIVSALAGQGGYDSIQIISHGAIGSLTIGSTALDSSTIGSYTAQLAQIGSALTETGDLLLYGCNVAAGDQGRQFIDTLSHITGADVAASDDATGGTAAGGDWALEVSTGLVDQAAVLHTDGYGALLVTTSIPIDDAHWNVLYKGTQQYSDNGLTFYGSGARVNNVAYSEDGYNFANSEVLVKWQANGANNYMDTGPRIVNSTLDFTYGGNLTTQWSFNGSTTIPQNTWLYTRIVFPGDTTGVVSVTTSTGNYSNAGGSILRQDILSASHGLTGTIAAGLGDNYGSTSSSLLLAEVTTTATVIPRAASVVYDFNDGLLPTGLVLPASAIVSGQTLLVNPNKTPTQTVTINVSGYSAISFIGSTDNNPATANDNGGYDRALIKFDGVQRFDFDTTGATQWNRISIPVPEGTQTMQIVTPTYGGRVWLDDITLYHAVVEDKTAPVFASATVNGSTLVMSYTELNTLDATNTPAATAFAVSGVSSGAHTVSAVAVNADLKTVMLTFATAVANGETVTVTYNDPTTGNDANAIQDAAGNDAATFTAQSVTNNTLDTTGPTLSSSNPTDNAISVAVSDNIVLTFSEAVKAGTGNIVISNGNGDVRTISVNDSSQVTINGSTLTINPTADLSSGSNYNAQLAAGVIKDLGGNAFAGLNDSTALNFYTNVNNQPVVIVSDNFNDNSFDASKWILATGTEFTTAYVTEANGELKFWNACTLTLGKNIDSRNGSVTIEFDFKPSNNDEWVYLRLRSRADTLNNPETRAGIDKYDFLIIANTGGIGVAGGQSWNPGTVFVNQYSHVKIVDVADHIDFYLNGAFLGTVLNPAFTNSDLNIYLHDRPQDGWMTGYLYVDNISVTQAIIDSQVLTLSSSTPADNATAVGVSDNIVLTFSEAVMAGMGNITISNGTDTRTMSVTDSQITINGNTVTINPATDLLAGSNYNVQMASGVIKDMVGNSYAGINDATTLNFNTNTAPTLNDSTKSGNEDTTITFTANDFTSHYSDAENTSLSTIKVTSLPGHGILKLSGAVVTLNQEITAADLANLTFVPTAQWHGSDSFGWQASDGKAYSAVAATVNLAVNAIPDILIPLSLSFADKVDYPTGITAWFVITADVNLDKMPDVVVSNYTSSTVSVFKSNGDGTFADKVDYTTAKGPTAVTSADVNSDGKVDLITSNHDSGNVSVLINKGDGTFAAKVDYAAGSWPIFIASADINGDNKADIIVPNRWSSALSFLTNNGDGTFASGVTYPTGRDPYTVTTADVNGDGKADLIVGYQYGNMVSVLTNDGGGAFTRKDYQTVGTPVSAICADINNDGKVDLIVTSNDGSNMLSVLKNKGDGTFEAKVDYQATGSMFVTAADVNGDGYADIIVTGEGNVVSVLKNNGDGTFAPKVTYATGNYPSGVANADINGDGKADLLVTNYQGNSVSVLINTSQVAVTSFTEQTSVKVSSGIVINDPDGNASWNGGNLKVQITGNAEAADTLSLATVNPGGSGIWLDSAAGNKLMAGATEIGTADAASAGNGVAWSLSFNASATNALVQDVARAVTFNNSSDAPSTADRTVTITAIDNLGAAASVVQKITVTPVNDAPSSTDGSTTTNEDTAKLLSLADFGTYTDPEGTALAKVQITTLESAGALQYHDGTSWTDVTLNQEITATDITAGKLRFDPVANANGSTYAMLGYKVSDGQLYSASAYTLTVNVTAVNDAPAIGTGVFAGSVTELADHATGENTTNLTATGSFAISDVDKTNTQTVTATPAGTGYLGTFTPTVTDQTTTDGTGAIGWNFMVADSAVDYLAAGQTLTQTYTVKVTDTAGATASKDVVVTINGTNDAPVVDAIDVTGAITEMVTPVGNLTDSGTIGFSDVDLADVHSLSTVTASSGALGTLTPIITTDTTGTGLNGVVAWNYSVAASAVEYIAEGETKVESFTFSVLDGHGGSVERTVDVTITGTNEDTTAPTLTTSTPVDNATSVAVGSNIVLTFSEAVQAGTGNITISNGNGDTRIIDIANNQGQVSISGSTVTINPAADLNPGGSYNVQMASGVFKDLAGNAYAGISDATTLNFTTVLINNAPTLTNFTGGGNEDATITFAAIDFTNHYSDLDGDTLAKVQITALPGHGTLKLSGAAVTLNQVITAADLANLTFVPTAHWHGSDSFGWQASDGTAYSAASATVNLTVVDTVAPTITTMTPADNTIAVPVDSNIVLTFSEAVKAGTGTIAIHSASATGTVVESYDVATSANLTIADNTLTINPTANLANSSHYFVTFDAGSIKDAAGNSFAGTTSYDFVTENVLNDLIGSARFWKTGAPISNVTSTLTPSASSGHPIEFRNIQTAADGSRTIEIWETSSRTDISDLSFDLALPTGSVPTWQAATTLPAGWTSVATTTVPAAFMLAGLGSLTTPLSAGSVKLGTLTLSAPTNPSHFDLTLVMGSVGGTSISPFGIVPDATTTGSDGLYQHLDLVSDTYTLQTTKPIDATIRGHAVTSGDALAALKIALLINPNSDGSPVSPYQYLAADVNKDGRVTSGDALNILKMAIQYPGAPTNEWLFEEQSVGSETMSRTAVHWPVVDLSIPLDHNMTLDLIGIVKGDINGSWVG